MYHYVLCMVFFSIYHSFYSTWVQNTCKYYRTRKLFYSAQNTARSKSIMQCINVIGCESLEANWEWVSARLSFTNSLGILRSLKHLRVVVFFYHAMHFSAKRGIAIACHLSV